jgi:hypothetical protein
MAFDVMRCRPTSCKMHHRHDVRADYIVTMMLFWPEIRIYSLAVDRIGVIVNRRNVAWREVSTGDVPRVSGWI